MSFIVGYLLIGTFLAGMTVGTPNFANSKSELKNALLAMITAFIVTLLWPSFVIVVAMDTLLGDEHGK